MADAVLTSDQHVQYVRQFFRDQFQEECELLASAPGRVNLIGEHTDYNDGYVLPMALDREVTVAARKRKDRKLRLYSADYRQGLELDLDQLAMRKEGGWDNYVAAVHWALNKEGYNVSGADLLIMGSLPQGCGLSSSAALELAVARAACGLGRWIWDPPAMALLCQRAENEFVGVNCGIMDQFAVAVAEPHCALFLDCRSLKSQSLPVRFKDAVFVVVNSMVSRGLQSSRYNERRLECELAVQKMQVLDPALKSLRDASLKALEKSASGNDAWVRRARHVVTENARVLGAVEALKKNDAVQFGKLMNASHDSLRDDYEVSCKELDMLVEGARACDGVYGARLTGAGFGGCTVNLVERSKVEALQAYLGKTYKDATGKTAQMFSFMPGQAARIVFSS